ncbi:hypothetical protein CR513_12580, partial [Mucuna pruriens]
MEDKRVSKQVEIDAKHRTQIVRGSERLRLRVQLCSDRTCDIETLFVVERGRNRDARVMEFQALRLSVGGRISVNACKLRLEQLLGRISRDILKRSAFGGCS